MLAEPTAGLDPLMEAVFQEVIHEAKAAGRSVLLSSHILSQVEALSDRISIIRSGNIVESGTLSELRHMTRTTIEVQTESPADELASVSFVHAFHTEGSPSTGERSVFEVDGDHVGEVMQRLAGLGVHSIVAHPPTLEQLLMRHYGDDLSARGVSTSTQKKVS